MQAIFASCFAWLLGRAEHVGEEANNKTRQQEKTLIEAAKLAQTFMYMRAGSTKLINPLTDKLDQFKKVMNPETLLDDCCRSCFSLTFVMFYTSTVLHCSVWFFPDKAHLFLDTKET